MKHEKATFTKQAVKCILVVALFDLQLSYVLAFLGREQIAETLSITVVTEIIAVMLGYYLKSFHETREEERVRLIEKGQSVADDFTEEMNRIFDKNEMIENLEVGDIDDGN
ncbi:MAG: hypothetical protein ACK5I7_03050 [Anaerotignum sp.]